MAIMQKNISFNDSPSPYYDESGSERKGIHELTYPKQPNQSNQLEPSIRNLIIDNPSFRSQPDQDFKQQGKTQVELLISEQSTSKVNKRLFHSEFQKMFLSFSLFLYQPHLKINKIQIKLKFEIIWHHLSIIQNIFMLIYIPFQYSYDTFQFNYLQIAYYIFNFLIYFQFQEFIKDQQIQNQDILRKHFLLKILPKDTLILICLFINLFRINFEIDCLVIIIIIFQCKRKLTMLWRRFYQYQLDFYWENLLTLAFKIIIIINAITCFYIALVRRSAPSTTENSMSQIYIISTNVSLTILSLNYQGNQPGLLIRLISFFAIFLVVYLIHSFYKLLSEQGIEIHNFLKSNNFNFVLREKLLNSIGKQDFERKIHFPKRLADEIKVNQRLPLLVRHFKGYDALILKDIAIKSDEITFQPSESILNENVPDDCSLYFLLDGYAEIRSSNFVLHTMAAPYVFGEMSFFTQQPRLASVVALTQCVILKVPRQVMIAGLGQTEKELFHQQKDQISLYNNLPIQCYCCKSSRHCIAQCNVFRIEIHPEVTHSLAQPRLQYIRKSKKSLRMTIQSGESKLSFPNCKMKKSFQSMITPIFQQSYSYEPFIRHAISNQEQKPNKSLNTEIKQLIFHKEKQQQQQFSCVLEKEEISNSSDSSERSESCLNTNLLPNWDMNPPILHSENNISKIMVQGENTIVAAISVPISHNMSISSFQDKAFTIQDLQFFIINDFEQCKLFSNYFPTGNFDTLIEQFNQKL